MIDSSAMICYFDDIKDMSLSSYPTRLNAACLTVCLKGWCKLELNLQQCEMREGMLGIILPDQIVLQGERSDDFAGLFIAVSKDFMDMVIPTMQQLFPMFFMIKERPFVHITPEESQSFQEYHSFLWSKVKLKDNPSVRKSLRGCCWPFFMRYIISIKTCHPGTHSQKQEGRLVRALYPCYFRVL